jgi:hypothetical protein
MGLYDVTSYILAYMNLQTWRRQVLPPQSFTMLMEAAGFSAKLVYIWRATVRYIAENRIPSSKLDWEYISDWV